MVKKRTTPDKKKSSPRSTAGTERYTIHLISGSTGDLLFRLASVAETQFSGIEFEILSHPLADTHEKLERVLQGIAGPRAIVIHGLPDASSKQFVRSYCVRQLLPHFDATGPLFDFMADCVGQLADNDLSQLHKVDAAYRRRIEAMEFAMEHDDGLGGATLKEADIVIVGLSRVSKSPTTLYLGSRGYKVANVSISPETGFPSELARVGKKKIIAFTMQPKRLHEIRVERMKHAGAGGTDYDDLQSVIREVLECEQECRRRGYPIIDVTNLTIEQTAVQVMKALGVTAT
ncbi:pyruvate, phosphate dikinase/phosphoenolpyruvate synthase regulator [Bythopirellula polymerisocia]|uniref:Putative pyruvate, phosphate dikinase regulatory protein n=1 Tax=Bythopirellula polymerisocia TaxID=2528003 RepID=A0A5C6D2Z0_9BACT|nr:pyruvate, phosphate dikinase/phosphoenolpyruvate synthase regulator [Bythopirellula polymerisocia]TWU30224.1 putative pyruvate, phosphate dikinase regulatory protein [Bythopirellula polymerisocia]